MLDKRRWNDSRPAEHASHAHQLHFADDARIAKVSQFVLDGAVQPLWCLPVFASYCRPHFMLISDGSRSPSGLGGTIESTGENLEHRQRNSNGRLRLQTTEMTHSVPFKSYTDTSPRTRPVRADSFAYSSTAPLRKLQKKKRNSLPSPVIKPLDEADSPSSQQPAEFDCLGYSAWHPQGIYPGASFKSKTATTPSRTSAVLTTDSQQEAFERSVFQDATVLCEV